MMKRKNSEKVFNVFNIILMVIIAILTLYPIIYVLAASLSEPKYINAGQVWLMPKGFTLEAYKLMITENGVLMGFVNSMFYMFVGTAVSIILTVLGAYPLSRKNLPGSRAINFMVTATMWLSAGLIPTYINFYELNLLNSRWGYIIAHALSVYNFIILRTYFASIPDALEEAAKIDGASELYVLLKIFIPLSMPAIATVALFYAVSKWNGYFWAMIMFRDDNKMTLQVILKGLIVEMSGKGKIDGGGADMSMVKTSAENVAYATIMMTILPMLIVYPYIQKFFVKGVMVGSVKG